MSTTKITILLQEPKLAPSFIKDSEIKGSLKLSILTDLGEICAPYYYTLLPSQLEEALKGFISYLQSFLDIPLDDPFGIGEDNFYENIPNVIDEIGQIFHHIQNPKIRTKYKKLYEKTLHLLNGRFSKDFDEDVIPTWDSETIKSYIELSNEF